MRIKPMLRRVKPPVSAVHVARRRRQIRSRDRAAFEYFQRPRPHKIHLGSGSHILADWFNVDVFPVYKGAHYLDATKAFPFSDASFDFIFSEHMIEHLEYLKALAMLKECFRILRPDAVIRIATPDLEFIARLYSPGIPQSPGSKAR